MYNNKIGVIFNLDRLLDEGPDVLFELGIETIQLSVWDTKLSTAENAEKVKKLLDGKIQVTSVWGGWTGPQVWDFVDGPITLGLVPQDYRSQRVKELKCHADFAKAVGSPNLVTHMGFLPENPYDPNYRPTVQAIRQVADHCRYLGIDFNFETGQETPVTLMRTIQDVGNPNLGVNFDPANIIMYGKGNPVDAIDIYGDRIRGIHVKDGNYPKGDFHELGDETFVGDGTVNHPVFLPKLIRSGYKGDLYIEREISGEQQITDIKKTISYVRGVLAQLNKEDF